MADLTSPSDITGGRSEFSDNLEPLHFDLNNLGIVYAFDDSTLMTTFTRIVIKCILHECIDQLQILRNIISQNNSVFVKSVVGYVSIKHKYMGVENHAGYRINTTNSNHDKLAKDINMFINILRECKEEINFGGTYAILQNSLKALKLMIKDEKKLLEEKEKNEHYIEELRHQCEEERIYNIHTIEETNAKIQKLRFEVEDILVYGKNEIKYFDRWEDARREQNEIYCEGKETDYSNTINNMKIKIDLEMRCHMELENYLEESKNDYLEEIQYWMKHYDEEIETRESDMINLRTDMEKLVEDHNHLKATYADHKAEIETYLEYKRLKKEKEELEQLRLWAAIKIQAWWRGTMYRKKLGPYKKKKKGKGGKGNKKGGKKKK